MISRFFFLIVVLFLFFSANLVAGEILATDEDQQDLRVTIYNKDLALVYDQRKLALKKGLSTLAFREVSGRMLPATAFLEGVGVQVLEQNFEYDLLTPQSLLNKYIGRQVIVSTVNPVTGIEQRENAMVLSTGSGTVFKMSDHIRTNARREQILFPDVPIDLRDRPTLTMLIDTEEAGDISAALTYLTAGLSWQADYKVELNDAGKKLQLNGWVTLTNNSGIAYTNAQLQLVAGDVNIVHDPGRLENVLYSKAAAPMPAMEESMEQESMFEYHLYSLGRRTTLKENQQKQVALMQAADVSCEKQYIMRGSPSPYHEGVGQVELRQKIGVFVKIKNDAASGLGTPLPAGVVRVYTRDSSGFLKFIGEDTINHTPENKPVRLKLGEAFDVTATKRQLDFEKIAGALQQEYITESEYEVTFKNAKKEPVSVRVEEPVPGDWQMIRTTLKPVEQTARVVVWEVPVPPQGEQKLTYRVRVKY